MKVLKHIVGLCLLALAATDVRAQTTLISNWNLGAWIIPNPKTTTLYGASNPSANWANEQWGNLPNLGAYQPVICAQGSNCFLATSPYVTSTLFTDGVGNVWDDIVQDGRVLACTNELDVGLQAIDSRYPAYPSAVLATANLGTAQHLWVTVTVEPVAFQTIDLNCHATHAVVRVGLLLKNQAANQQLVYTVRLFLYRKGRNNPPVWWDDKGPVFGYDDSLTTFGLPLATLGQASTYSIDVLPALQQVISAATNGLDSNIANWNTAWAYTETHANGDIVGEVEWSGFSLVAD